MKGRLECVKNRSKNSDRIKLTPTGANKGMEGSYTLRQLIPSIKIMKSQLDIDTR